MTKIPRSILAFGFLAVAARFEPEDPFTVSSDDLEKEEIPVNDVALPALIGYKMVQTVEGNDGQSTTIAPGKTITYQL